MVNTTSSLAVHNELRHGINVHAARELLLLHLGEEQGDKLLAKSRSYDLKQLCQKIPESEEYQSVSYQTGQCISPELTNSLWRGG